MFVNVDAICNCLIPYLSCPCDYYPILFTYTLIYFKNNIFINRDTQWTPK